MCSAVENSICVIIKGTCLCRHAISLLEIPPVNDFPEIKHNMAIKINTILSVAAVNFVLNYHDCVIISNIRSL